METKDASEDQREVTQSLKITQNQQCVLFCMVNLRNGSVIYQGSKLLWCPSEFKSSHSRR